MTAELSLLEPGTYGRVGTGGDGQQKVDVIVVVEAGGRSEDEIRFVVRDIGKISLAWANWTKEDIQPYMECLPGMEKILCTPAQMARIEKIKRGDIVE